MALSRSLFGYFLLLFLFLFCLFINYNNLYRRVMAARADIILLKDFIEYIRPYRNSSTNEGLIYIHLLRLHSSY